VVQPQDVRLFYRVSYLLFLASAHIAAWLADRHRALRRTESYAPALVPVQMVVLLAWFPARAVSLGSFEICRMLVARTGP